jgi:hypothetical protein
MIFLRKHGHFPRLLSFSVAFWSKKSGPTAALPTKKVPGGASFKKANGVGSVHLKCEARDQWISGSSFFFGEDARETTKHGLLEKGRTVKKIQRVTRKTCCRHLILQSVLGMNLVKNISIYSGFICSVVTVVFKF